MRYPFLFLFILNFTVSSCAQPSTSNFTKIERMIPMRDGVKLFTTIYIPKQKTGKFPILMERTPYSCSPYGEDKFPIELGPASIASNDEYIYVYQDVRGRT